MGRFVAWVGDFSLERQKLWLSKDDLQDSASWSSPPWVLLRDIHHTLSANYDCRDTAPPPAQSGTGARVGPSQRRLLPSFFHRSTSFMRLQLCGERTLPMLSPSGGGPPLHLYHTLGCQEGSRLGVDQLADLFRTTHKVKTQQVARRRGQWCGDIELAGYLANAVGPVPLVSDLRIAHERFGSSSDLSINGHLHYPNDVDRSLNEDATDEIRKYRADYK